MGKQTKKKNKTKKTTTKKTSFLYTNKYNRENLMVWEEPETSLFPVDVHFPKSDSQNTRKMKLLLSYVDRMTTSFHCPLFIKHHFPSSLLPFTFPSAHSCCQTLISSSLPFVKNNVKDSEGQLTDWLLFPIKPNTRFFISLTIQDFLRGFSVTV